MTGKIITKEDFLAREEFYLGEIKKGKIFIYPTDTIYGIGCDATNGEAINKIREIKKRDVKPFSVKVPSKKWIIDNCVVPKKFEKDLDRLPGTFTLILKMKTGTKVAKKELVGEADTLGVRIPDNWFGEFISKNNLVFVTTSVNVTGQRPIQNTGELSKEIFDKVDYIIEDGELNGSASTLIDLTQDKIIITKR